MENQNTPLGLSTDLNKDIGFEKSSSETSGFGNFLEKNGKVDYFRIGLILVVLLFLGFNIFSYLGDLLDYLKEIFAPLLKGIMESLGYTVAETTKSVTKITADGAKVGIDVAAGTVESGVNVLQGQLDMEDDKSSSTSNKKQNPSTTDNTLTTALSDAEKNSVPLPDDATSSTQRVKPGKSGYCYIGEDRGFRSCVPVRADDVCMSGDIFPSKDICVNPSLRE
tara:strand:- start:198 stop:866 length:669 start_codon:yes stop_codon:yes gene_type:complete